MRDLLFQVLPFSPFPLFRPYRDHPIAEVLPTRSITPYPWLRDAFDRIELSGDLARDERSRICGP